MNEKEIREIRKRFRPEKNAIGKIYGCFVNESGKIVASFEESLSFLPEDEAERFLSLFKKSISGSLGKNLINLEFTTKQVMESEEHKLLSAMRSSELKDEGLRQTFFERVSETLDIDSGYVILLAHDAYDVPFRTKEDTFSPDMSDEQFSYMVCAICPVKQTSPGLGYHAGENRVHSTHQGLILSAPELGFMFPLFDGRAANIYGVLYHIKNAAKEHQAFIESIFGIEPPMPAPAQKEVFQEIFAETLKEDCNLATVQAVHEQLGALIDQHKESREPEQLLVCRNDISAALEGCGVSGERIEAFADAFDARFGEDAELPPENIIDRRQFVINTPETVIKVDPDQSSLIQTRVIDGMKYILIPAGSGVAVNGVNVQIPQ